MKAFFHGPLVPLRVLVDRVKNSRLVGSLRRFTLYPVLNRVDSRPYDYRRPHVAAVENSSAAANLNADLASVSEFQIRLLLLDQDSLLVESFDFSGQVCLEDSVFAVLPFLPVALATRNQSFSFFLVMSAPEALFFSGGDRAAAETIREVGRVFGVELRDVVMVVSADPMGGAEWRSVFDGGWKEPGMRNRREVQALIDSGCFC